MLSVEKTITKPSAFSERNLLLIENLDRLFESQVQFVAWTTLPSSRITALNKLNDFLKRRGHGLAAQANEYAALRQNFAAQCIGTAYSWSDENTREDLAVENLFSNVN